MIGSAIQHKPETQAFYRVFLPVVQPILTMRPETTLGRPDNDGHVDNSEIVDHGLSAFCTGVEVRGIPFVREIDDRYRSPAQATWQRGRCIAKV
jgi:hypothetical protein